MEVIDLKIRTIYSAVERGAVRESASNGMGFGQTHGLHIIFSKIINRYSLQIRTKRSREIPTKLFMKMPSGPCVSPRAMVGKANWRTGKKCKRTPPQNALRSQVFILIHCTTQILKPILVLYK